MASSILSSRNRYKKYNSKYAVYFWLRQELRESLCPSVCLSGTKWSKELNLLSQVCLRSVSGQSQVSLRSVSGQSQISVIVRSVSGQS